MNEIDRFFRDLRRHILNTTKIFGIIQKYLTFFRQEFDITKIRNDRIDEGIEAGIFIEHLAGKKLEFVETSAKTMDALNENGGV